MTPQDAPPGNFGLADLLKQRTQSLHTQAERTGVTAQILRGKATRAEYALMLRSLVPVYRELESALAARRDGPALRHIATAPVQRLESLERDLGALVGAQWRRDLPTLPGADLYVRQIRDAAEGDGSRLIAHAYVRYLGDLNGGQALSRLLSRSLGLGPECLNFYEFAAVDDLTRFRADYRASIDRAGSEAADPDAIIEEGALAFQLNIDLSEAVARAQDAVVARTAVESSEALA